MTEVTLTAKGTDNREDFPKGNRKHKVPEANPQFSYNFHHWVYIISIYKLSCLKPKTNPVYKQLKAIAPYLSIKLDFNTGP